MNDQLMCEYADIGDDITHLLEFALTQSEESLMLGVLPGDEGGTYVGFASFGQEGSWWAEAKSEPRKSVREAVYVALLRLHNEIWLDATKEGEKE